MDKRDETAADSDRSAMITQMIVDTSRFRRAGAAEGGAADARLPRNAATIFF